MDSAGISDSDILKLLDELSEAYLIAKKKCFGNLLFSRTIASESNTDE